MNFLFSVMEKNKKQRSILYLCLLIGDSTLILAARDICPSDLHMMHVLPSDEVAEAPHHLLSPTDAIHLFLCIPASLEKTRKISPVTSDEFNPAATPTSTGLNLLGLCLCGARLCLPKATHLADWAPPCGSIRWSLHPRHHAKLA